MSITALALAAAAPATALAAGSISGTVKDIETGTGIAGVEVCAENQTTFEETCTSAPTGADGKYEISLGEGKYEVAFFPLEGVGYLIQFYKEHDLRPATPNLVEVETSEVKGIDARLKRGGVIKGQVTDALTHVGVEDAEVCVNPNGTGINRCFDVGAEGKYSSPALTPGSYTVSFWDEEDEYLPIAYNQKSLGDGELVPVTAGGTATGIDGALSKGSSISGTVLEVGSAYPLSEVVVCLHDVITEDNKCVYTSSSGVYKFGALQNGKYKVGFSEEPDPIFKDAFDTQYFDGVATLDAATVLQVGTNTTLTQIDADLHKTGSGVEEKAPSPGGGGGGGGGQVTPQPESPKFKPLKCKKGFKKKTVKGKARCVKKKKHHKH